MITGKTIIKREVVDAPESENVIRKIEANTVIVATENKIQWLHLLEGGWVNAGVRQQYIKWQVDASPAPPLTPPESPNPEASLIKGRTVIRREVVDKPGSENVIRMIPANVDIIVTENKFQWLHLIDGGWVNAGAGQQYIKWEVVTNPPIPPPPSPTQERMITEIKRKGRIATLLVDWQNPKWGFAPRQVGNLSAYPQTVPFNSIPRDGKGSRIPLTEPILEYLGKLNGLKVKEKILVPSSGWINNPTIPPTIERLSWAANHVVVSETQMKSGVEYSNIHASSCNAEDLGGTFFEKDMRLIVHKFNACVLNSKMIKLGSGIDCYTPFITDPDLANGDMWIRSEYLEMWPELPFTLTDGTQIFEYELYGYKTYGIRRDGSAVLLREPKGFQTNWKINSPELPV